MPKGRIDFDGEATRFVQDAYDQADQEQTSRDRQYERDWLSYLAYIDMAERDPDLPNISLPKLYSIVETKVPGDANALFGRRPIIPFEARRKEFRKAAEVQTAILDELLHKARIYLHGSFLVKLKTLYGTSFINVLPYYEETIEKQLVPAPEGGMRLQQYKAYRLRLRVEIRAPWEVRVDRHAIDLHEKESCRYLIKVDLASKRNIKSLAARGGYPQLDIEKLDAYRGSSTRYRAQHWGLRMLSSYGLPEPLGDDDIGVILRLESPERYIDSWMGEVTLRDIDNPFDHGLINTSRMIHVTSPHTQNRFWGIGEAKPNEIQIAMLNDLYNLTFAAHGMVNQPVVFFRKGKVNVEDIMFALGQRIPVATRDDRPITDDILIDRGTGLPRDHYMLPDKVERNIDLTSGSFGPGRGESLRPTGDVKATEVILATERGDVRQQEGVRLAEQDCLADFGKKGASIVEQHSNFDDLVEIVGEADAMQLLTANPADLPGGFNFSFKGSDRVAQLAVKQQNLRNLAPLLINSPTARLGGVEKKLLELHDFDSTDIEEMQLTDEEIQQKMQMQMLMAAFQAQGQQPGNKKQPAGQVRQVAQSKV